MTTHKSIEDIAKEVELEFQMGGLSYGLYFDFAKEVATRYAQQQVQEVVEEYKTMIVENLVDKRQFAKASKQDVYSQIITMIQSLQYKK